MTENFEITHRKSIRLKEYDYSHGGYYFVTICTKEGVNLFGKIHKGKMILNEFGKIVFETWIDLPNHNSNIGLDYFCIMPNHVHFILIINEMIRAGLEPAPTEHGLAEIIRQFKTFSSKKINIINKSPGKSLWQRNYYEHVIRNEKDLYEIRKYIEQNPLNWEKDEYYE